MRDLLLVTVESARADHSHHLDIGLDATTAIAAGNYTRPALAGLLSGRATAATEAACQAPALATVLRDAGYSTIAVSHSPQTVRGLGFHDGFETVHHDPGDAGGRGSRWREWLGQFRPVRRVHRRLRPKAATLAQIPTDEMAIAQAWETWQAAAPPRFMWVHLMGSHRPYGRGDDALPVALSRQATAATPGRLTPTLSDADAARVREHYTDALARTGDRVARLVDAVDGAVVVVGDHGEDLGEEGYWFHGPYRRRVSDALVRVPLWTTLPVGDGLVRQVDIPGALCRAAGIDPPTAWAAAELGAADHAVTVAPWAGQATLRYTTDSGSIVVRDGGVDASEDVGEVDAATKERLAALGYR